MGATPISFSVDMNVAATTTATGNVTTGCGMYVNFWFR
jgi:hypothetical protein